MPAFNHLRILQLSFFILISANVSATLAQTTSTVIGDSNRREMDRLLLRTPIPTSKKDNGSTQALLKQINDDFIELQVLDRKIKLAARPIPLETPIGSEAIPTRPEVGIDYREVEGILTQIRDKATRLKSNLVLPAAKETNDTRPNAKVSSAEDFQSVALELDKLIVSFTTNPLFQQANVVDVKLGVKASRDLDAIIELSTDLRKAVKKLKPN